MEPLGFLLLLAMLCAEPLPGQKMSGWEKFGRAIAGFGCLSVILTAIAFCVYGVYRFCVG